MKFIWVTRGRNWGFRFLRTAGYEDPLPVYEEAFNGVESKGEAFLLKGATAVLRIPDPLDRRDAAGRLIPHEFVVFGDPGWGTFEEGRDALWPLVEEEFARVWGAPTPPPPPPQHS